jgi:hypothetical protein
VWRVRPEAVGAHVRHLLQPLAPVGQAIKLRPSRGAGPRPAQLDFTVGAHASIKIVFEIGDPAGTSTVALFLKNKSIINIIIIVCVETFTQKKVVIEKGSTARVG